MNEKLGRGVVFQTQVNYQTMLVLGGVLTDSAHKR